VGRKLPAVRTARLRSARHALLACLLHFSSAGSIDRTPGRASLAI